jgi:ribosomal protein L37AE/L43A
VLTDSETPHSDAFGHPIHESDDECEFCGRSMVARFGGIPPYECDSCSADFKLLNAAGKLELQ